ncbi:MAG: ubiquinol-cytochrome C chaperone [Hyphomicrobiales bacterium]|nr:ubiquinol-cytochrome C chaperone [Hyphomicrobiales bacterium]
MIFKLFARRTDTDAVERLYGQIMAAARRPELFLGRYGAPDTLDGRFDLLVVHLFPVVRRLAALPPPAPAFAQALSDHVFLGFDRALREMGVGDLAVPKRMKKLAADYNGRRQAYESALQAGGEDELAAAVARNVLGSADAGRGRALARYMLAVVRALEGSQFGDFEAGRIIFPDPTTIA